MTHVPDGSTRQLARNHIMLTSVGLGGLAGQHPERLQRFTVRSICTAMPTGDL